MLFYIKQKIYILYVGESGLTLRTVVTGRLDFKAVVTFGPLDMRLHCF